MSDLFSGLANVAKQVTSNISTYEVRKITDKIQGYVMNYTEAENLVREATNEDPWGPTGPQMKEICHLTFQYDGFHQVTEMLWKRMFEDNKYAWRRVYKSLTLLNYLLQHGSERVIANSRDHVFQLRSLESYKHIDEKGKDQGVNIRHRVGIILELLNDDDKLRAERKKAKTDSKERYQGYTSDDIRRGRGGAYNGKPSSFSSNTGAVAKKYDDDDWNDNKKEDYYNKEVNQFSFPEDARQSSHSPELGFRQDDEKEQGDDDDGFGSFAAARTKDASSPSPAKGFADFSSAASKTAHVPAIPPPITVKTTSTVSASNSATNDLLGLGDFGSLSQTSPASSSDPFGAASPSQPVDFFSAPVVTNNATAHPPRPPSGGGLIDAAPVQSSSGFNVNWNSAPPAASAAGDLFGDFNSTPSAVQSPGDFASFDAFGSFQSPAAPTPQAASNADFFGGFAAATSPVIPQQSSGLDDIFSNNLTLTPSTPVPAKIASMATPAPAANKSQTKVGNTWAGVGLIDLDNLAGKASPAKQSLSLNQMQQQKQGSGSSGMW